MGEGSWQPPCNGTGTCRGGQGGGGALRSQPSFACVSGHMSRSEVLGPESCRQSAQCQ